MRDCIGINVAKQYFDLHCLKTRQDRRMDNSADGIRQCVAFCKESRPQLIVMEATGGYELTLAGTLHAEGFAVAVVNPRRIRDFAKAAGQMAKTDKLDARIIAQFAATLEPLWIESEYIKVHGLAQVEVGFTRSDLCGAAFRFGPGEIRVCGEFVWGQAFFGKDTMRLAGIDFGSLAAISQHWLENGCRKPDWCGGADIDASGTVDFADFVDFSLIDSCCLEVF